MVDDGTGVKEVFRVEAFDLVSLPEEQHGTFFSGDCYVVRPTVHSCNSCNLPHFMHTRCCTPTVTEPRTATSSTTGWAGSAARYSTACLHYCRLCTAVWAGRGGRSGPPHSGAGPAAGWPARTGGGQLSRVAAPGILYCCARCEWWRVRSLRTSSPCSGAR